MGVDLSTVDIGHISGCRQTHRWMMVGRSAVDRSAVDTYNSGDRQVAGI